ncbi:carboxymuconolactone decarboxylase family protein [Streptomyces sp. DSM 116496]|uniref:carboxymuconolactone decarboxylase family protein n=1 Tax=Streptomyces stoeckheimensis TaxID=3344656 RepID=UPI0038B36420
MQAYATHGDVEKKHFEIYTLAASIVGGTRSNAQGHIAELKKLGITAAELRDVGELAAAVHSASKILQSQACPFPRVGRGVDATTPHPGLVTGSLRHDGRARCRVGAVVPCSGGAEHNRRASGSLGRGRIVLCPGTPPPTAASGGAERTRPTGRRPRPRETGSERAPPSGHLRTHSGPTRTRIEANYNALLSSGANHDAQVLPLDNEVGRSVRVGLRRLDRMANDQSGPVWDG